MNVCLPSKVVALQPLALARQDGGSLDGCCPRRHGGPTGTGCVASPGGVCGSLFIQGGRRSAAACTDIFSHILTPRRRTFSFGGR